MTPEEFLQSIPQGADALMWCFVDMNKVKDHHRSLVIVTNGFLELVVEALIRAKCKNAEKVRKDHRTYSYAVKLLILNEIGAISDPLYEDLAWFNRKRNDAAHEPIFEFDENDKVKLKRWSDPRFDPFHKCCVHLILSLWGEQSELLRQDFTKQPPT